MNYVLIKDCIDLIGEFESVTSDNLDYGQDINSFKKWICHHHAPVKKPVSVEWEGKENGRSPESVISTLLVHLNRYAKLYSKSVILNTEFATQDDFIFLINLKTFGEMPKIDLIRKNIQDKPTGIQIINRLIKKGFIEQKSSKTDLRSKIVALTAQGLAALEHQMEKIRTASDLVTGNLTSNEKLELIQLLSKLEDFHQSLYLQNVPYEDLLSVATEKREKCQK